jgi:uncharacterized protein YbaP (TraB family)
MLRTILGLAALLTLASCADKPATPPAEANPALWVVRDADTTIYLFGTVHVLRPGLDWFDDGVRDAFDRSDTLVLELVAPPQEEMARIVRDLGTAQASEPRLPDQLPAASAARLKLALDLLGRPANSLDRAEPWFAAISVAMLPVREAGYNPADGAEERLTAAATDAGKQLLGLETAREQLGYFDRLSPAAQRAMLIEILDGLQDGQKRLDRVIDAWAAGDPDKVGALLNEETRSNPEVEKALLTDRNRRWADWIAVRMRQPGTIFLAVGAGHLAGKDSVLHELGERGLTVARIRY